MRVRVVRCFLLFLFILVGSTSLFLQASVNDSAVAFASHSITALTAGTTICEATLTSNVTWIAGSATDARRFFWPVVLTQLLDRKGPEAS